MNPTLSVVIPLWNEEKNIDALVNMFAHSGLSQAGMLELILVNNGSKDKTGELVDEAAKRFEWVVPLHLNHNLNYGGGIQHGLGSAKGDFLAFIPGDLQVGADDLKRLWTSLKEEVRTRNTFEILVKGWRKVRKDGFSSQFVSAVYTMIANVILGIWIRDLNALPKIFHRSLLQKLPSELIKTFVFDAQVISTAKCVGWPVLEIPVVFHARREGVSSWSGKRMRVYLESFKLLFKVRYLSQNCSLHSERS